jgi:hypothetical protein
MSASLPGRLAQQHTLAACFTCALLPVLTPHPVTVTEPCVIPLAEPLCVELQLMHAAGDASEVLNERAMAVMRRMTDKLMGRDHILEGSSATAECDSVPAQVQRLIAQAISHENLCQSYIGWCPFVSAGLLMSECFAAVAVAA